MFWLLFCSFSQLTFNFSLPTRKADVGTILWQFGTSSVISEISLLVDLLVVWVRGSCNLQSMADRLTFVLADRSRVCYGQVLR